MTPFCIISHTITLCMLNNYTAQKRQKVQFAHRVSCLGQLEIENLETQLLRHSQRVREESL